MYKAATRHLRFGCGASLHSAFLITQKQFGKEITALHDKENGDRLAEHRQRERGSNK